MTDKQTHKQTHTQTDTRVLRLIDYFLGEISKNSKPPMYIWWCIKYQLLLLFSTTYRSTLTYIHWESLLSLVRKAEPPRWGKATKDAGLLVLVQAIRRLIYGWLLEKGSLAKCFLGSFGQNDQLTRSCRRKNPTKKLTHPWLTPSRGGSTFLPSSVQASIQA